MTELDFSEVQVQREIVKLLSPGDIGTFIYVGVSTMGIRPTVDMKEAHGRAIKHGWIKFRDIEFSEFGHPARKVYEISKAGRAAYKTAVARVARIDAPKPPMSGAPFKTGGVVSQTLSGEKRVVPADPGDK